ncbi:hypothetical protein WJ976_01710 [Achromobacter denitrificans]
MTNPNNAAQAVDQEIEAIMEQAQVFASAWSFLGGPFDNGSGLETAEREKANLRALLYKLRAPVAVRQSWPRAGKLEIECDPDRFGAAHWHITDGFHHAIGATPNEALNRFYHHIANAPVAGEAVACLRRRREGSEWGHWTPATVEDGQRVTGLRSWQVRWLVDAAPQACMPLVEIRLPYGTPISGWLELPWRDDG